MRNFFLGQCGTKLAKLKSVFYFTLTMTLLGACARSGNQLSPFADDQSAGIIGGTPVSDQDALAKTIVAIYDTEQKSLCTGSIISNQLILTAAHCANIENPRAMVLLFGNQLPFGPNAKPVARPVVDLRVNKRYTQLMDQFEKNDSLDPDNIKEWGDVALLKFTGGLPAGFEAAHLLVGTNSLKNGGVVTLAGFGEINGVRHLPSNRLNQVEVRMADVNYSPTEVVMDQRAGKGACHGDSGGPAYVKVEGRILLFGVTSRGLHDPNNNCGNFSVYSKIPSLVGQLTADARELLAAPVPSIRPRLPGKKKRLPGLIKIAGL